MSPTCVFDPGPPSSALTTLLLHLRTANIIAAIYICTKLTCWLDIYPILLLYFHKVVCLPDSSLQKHIFAFPVLTMFPRNSNAHGILV